MNVHLPGVHLKECILLFKNKELPGSIEWPFNTRGERRIQTINNLVTAFLLCFSIDSDHSLCHSGTEKCQAQCCKAFLWERVGL